MKNKRNKKITLEDLARITKRGFDEVCQKMDKGFRTVDERFKAVDEQLKDI